jgi:hypothetical protein
MVVDTIQWSEFLIDDVWALVVSHLQPRHKAQLRQTCKRFKSIADGSVQQIKVRSRTLNIHICRAPKIVWLPALVYCSVYILSTYSFAASRLFLIPRLTPLVQGQYPAGTSAGSFPSQQTCMSPKLLLTISWTTAHLRCWCSSKCLTWSS